MAMGYCPAYLTDLVRRCSGQLLDRVGRCVTATMHQFIGHTYTLPPTSAVFSHLHSNVRDYPGMFVSQEVNRSARGTVLFKLRGVDIWATINQGLPPKTAGRFFLVDRQGTIISHPQLSEFAANADDLGQLVQAFVQMSDRFHRCDLQLKEQMLSLRVEIDRTRRDREVAEIVDSDRFQLLQQKIQQLRAHQQQDATFDSNEGADYFQQLQQRIGSLKDRVDPLA